MPLNILAVDGEPAITDLIRRILEREPARFHVTVANSIRAAVQMLAARPADAIVTGLWHPELISAARNQQSPPAVCYIPAAWERDANAGDFEASALLVKPFGVAELISTIDGMFPDDRVAADRSA